MFPFDQYYFLLHAYELLGRHLYDTDWTGQELKETLLDSPENVERKRAPLEKRIAEVNARTDELRAAIGRETKTDLMPALRNEVDALFRERAELQAALHRLPTLNDDYRRSYAAYQRAEKTKGMLTDALEAEAIRAQAGLGMMIEWPTWSRTPGFRCYVPLSLVVMPRSASGLRRATVLIKRKEFDAWLQSVLPLTPRRLEQLGPEARCSAWLIELASAHPVVRPNKKAVLRADAIEQFKISARGFDRLWHKHAPSTWTKGGAPKVHSRIIAPTRNKAR